MTREEKENTLHCLKVMIDEEVCEECKLYGTTGTDHCEADCIRMAIKELEQEPCEDCISRQIISDYVESHIQEINTGYGDLNSHTNRILRMIVDYIEKLPSVEPRRLGE